MYNIGLLNVKGALPLFENYGYLPTNIVKSDGTVENGKLAHETLDGIIIPGGSIMESKSITPELESEIKKINDNDGFILGICAGFQILSNQVNVGRNSPCPIIRKGMKLLDVDFDPLINTNQVKADIVEDNTLFTKGLKNTQITGFHCHTYGKIENRSVPVIYSDIKRSNYKNKSERVLSGVSNDKGNILGTSIHGILDNNPKIVENILEYIGAENDYKNIKERNKLLQNKIFNEIGVETKTYFTPKNLNKDTIPPVIMMVGTGSESGKTFLTAGIVGALRKQGVQTYVLKIGPDIRDLTPSLYINKEPMTEYSSIKIGDIGWMDLKEVLEKIKNKGYDLVIIEGVMSAVTGLLNKKTPYSTAEIAHAANIPTIMVSSVNKGGIETAGITIQSHIDLLKKLGIRTKGVILNMTYDKEIVEIVSDYINIHSNISKDSIWSFSKVKSNNSGFVPENYLQLEDFTSNAIKLIEENLDLNKFISLAEKVNFKGYLEFEEISSKYKN
ncbi:MAG: AAA family ATPase [Methanobacteriaceae archaeon]|nr:AAA family ATPase [Methanobacteriaceae archaeon]